MKKMKEKNPSYFFKGLISRPEIAFCISFAVIFFFSYSILYFLGLIPKEFLLSANDSPTIVEKLQENSLEGLGLAADEASSVISNDLTENKTVKRNVLVENPVRIVAPSISLNSIIENPISADYGTLDNSLMRGAVHYPGSGSVEAGNMFIFGHSTSFKVVNNPAYKVFNNIHALKEGDEINIYTTHQIFTYKVKSVSLENSGLALIDFSPGQRMLTLSTCNSLGEKTDRYVVQAIFDHTIDI